MRAAHKELQVSCMKYILTFSLLTIIVGAQDSFAAQSKLLSDANKKVFELRTEIKAHQHKVDRLHDYERQIEQLIHLQRLW